MEELKRERCECKNCGSEAEMVVTCELVDDEDAAPSEKGPEQRQSQKTQMKKKQTVTCKHCGNEAEMWLAE